MEQFINMLKTFDFKKGSVSSFSKQSGVSEKTIRKYLNIHNIQYNKKHLSTDNRTRNSAGQYFIKAVDKPVEKNINKQPMMEKKQPIPKPVEKKINNQRTDRIVATNLNSLSYKDMMNRIN